MPLKYLGKTSGTLFLWLSSFILCFYSFDCKRWLRLGNHKIFQFMCIGWKYILKRNKLKTITFQLFCNFFPFICNFLELLNVYPYTSFALRQFYKWWDAQFSEIDGLFIQNGNFFQTECYIICSVINNDKMLAIKYFYSTTTLKWIIQDT